MKKSYMYKIILIILFAAVFFPQPAYSDIVDNTLDISVLKYDPQPVEPGQNFDIWVKAENIGDSDIANAYIQINLKPPFLLQNGETGVRYTSAILKGDSVTYRFSLKADDNAIVGNDPITIGYKVNNFFTTRDFDIQIGYSVTDAKGVVSMQNYQINPEVLMPGDVGLITLSLNNSAYQSTVTIDGKDYSTNAQVQSVTMIDNPPIKVLSEPYSNVGIIGPGSSLAASFGIKVDNNTKNGIYFVDFDVVGSSNLQGKIPVKVDDSAVAIIPADISGSGISLNIANLRPNAIDAVTIIPYANDTVFTPAQYFIGTMETNEVSTIKFVTNSNEPPENLQLKAVFKNADNWHESVINLASSGGKITQPVQQVNPGGNVLNISLFTIIFLLGFYTYMKQRRRKSS